MWWHRPALSQSVGLHDLTEDRVSLPWQRAQPYVYLELLPLLQEQQEFRVQGLEGWPASLEGGLWEPRALQLMAKKRLGLSPTAARTGSSVAWKRATSPQGQPGTTSAEGQAWLWELCRNHVVVRQLQRTDIAPGREPGRAPEGKAPVPRGVLPRPPCLVSSLGLAAGRGAWWSGRPDFPS